MGKKMEKTITNKKDYKEWIKLILVIFMAVQPLLDIYMNLFDSKIQIFGVSAATIIRFVLVFVLLAVVIVKEIKRKSTKFFIAYALIVAVYTVFHHINASTFSIKLAQADYSFFGEIIYLARMCVPIALIYLVYIVKPSYKDIKKVVVWSAFTVSFVIILTNLLKVGFMAYSTDDVVISGTMVDWFTGNTEGYTWWELSCRGIFQATNQISGIVLVICPILTYICLVERKAMYWGVLAMHLIAMINLSTRIASIGGIAVFVGIVVIYVLEKIIHKQIDFKKLLNSSLVCTVVCLVISVVFLVYSPMSMRADEGGMFNDIISGSEDDDTPPATDFVEKDELPEDPEERRKYMINYIEANIPFARIQDLYIRNAYPYKDDPEFWYNIIKNVPESERYGNRNMRGYLIDRLFERDNRVSNELLGISYTRSSSFIWPERDIETHLDSLGIIGTIIFLGPYFLVLICGVIEFFKKFKHNLYLKKCVYLIAAGIGVVASYLSGHIMNEIFPALYLAFACGIVFNTVFGDTSVIHDDVKEEEKVTE